MRALVIEFEDDEAALKLKQQIETATKNGKRFRVVGLFAIPNRWCSCPTPEGYHKDEIQRGAKYGWWVHVVCRRPRLGTHPTVNLLKPDEVLQLEGSAAYIQSYTGLGVAERLSDEAKT